jgi:DNA repair exonuclease SbcCD ATPase subunit
MVLGFGSAHLGVTLERSDNIQTAQSRVKRAAAELADIQNRATEVETILQSTSTEYLKSIASVRHVLQAVNSAFSVTAVFDTIASQAATVAACEYVRLLFVDQSTQVGCFS